MMNITKKYGKIKQGKRLRLLLVTVLIFSITAGLIPCYTSNARVTTTLELTEDTILNVPPNTTPSGIHFSQLQKKIEEFVNGNEDKLAGLSISVFCRQDDIYTGHFGHSDIENNVPVDENTVYEWGSISKLLTWVSVMQLYEQGLIDLDKDIREYLPDGFFEKLSYDEPITMLNLMNHNAGWQEVVYGLETTDENAMLPLGEALKKTEPRQLYRPGEVTAYSNWGAALAGYVVENITGVDFADYVTENIFKPLGMEHTAIRGDHSDNQWVKEQREKTLCYSVTPNGVTGLGSCLSYILLYPAGAATGNLSDLLTFAKSFTATSDEECKLFNSIDTLKLMKEATLFFGDSDLERNCHGMWVSHFTNNTIGHNGATNGFSTTFMFDPRTGVGIVIMTNEMGEGTFNSGLPELIYGNYKYNSHLNNQTVSDAIDPSGAFISYRGFGSGPLKFMSALNFVPIGKSKNGINYPVVENISFTRLTTNEFLLQGEGTNALVYISENPDGSLKIETEGMDYYRISTLKAYTNLVLALFPLILMMLLIITGIIVLIILLIRHIKKKEKKERDGICRRIYLIQYILGIAFGIVYLLSYFTGVIPPAGKTLIPVCILTLLFAIAFTVLGLLNIIRASLLISKKKYKLWGSLKYYFISLAELVSVFCICYCEMFFFWRA